MAAVAEAGVDMPLPGPGVRLSAYRYRSRARHAWTYVMMIGVRERTRVRRPRGSNDPMNTMGNDGFSREASGLTESGALDHERRCGIPPSPYRCRVRVIGSIHAAKSGGIDPFNVSVPPGQRVTGAASDDVADGKVVDAEDTDVPDVRGPGRSRTGSCGQLR